MSNFYLIISKIYKIDIWQSVNNYAETKQKSEQKISDFINYFVSLKHNFEKLSESMHCDNLLNKMQKELYDKIVANQQISET